VPLEPDTLSRTAALNEAQILATWLNPVEFATKTPHLGGQLSFCFHEKRAQRILVVLRSRYQRSRVIFAIVPVVPFGHRPANCLQASGFLFRAEWTPSHSTQLNFVPLWSDCGQTIVRLRSGLNPLTEARFEQIRNRNITF